MTTKKLLANGTALDAGPSRLYLAGSLENLQIKLDTYTLIVKKGCRFIRFKQILGDDTKVYLLPLIEEVIKGKFPFQLSVHYSNRMDKKQEYNNFLHQFMKKNSGSLEDYLLDPIPITKEKIFAKQLWIINGLRKEYWSNYPSIAYMRKDMKKKDLLTKEYIGSFLVDGGHKKLSGAIKGRVILSNICDKQVFVEA